MFLAWYNLLQIDTKKQQTGRAIDSIMSLKFFKTVPFEINPILLGGEKR
jgi:hypothetical protein